jgi:hypothetical protein
LSFIILSFRLGDIVLQRVRQIKGIPIDTGPALARTGSVMTYILFFSIIYGRA